MFNSSRLEQLEDRITSLETGRSLNVLNQEFRVNRDITEMVRRVNDLRTDVNKLLQEKREKEKQDSLAELTEDIYKLFKLPTDYLDQYGKADVRKKLEDYISSKGSA